MALLEAAMSLLDSPPGAALDDILRALSRTTPADALVLLRVEADGALRVASQIGLSASAAGVRFRAAEHPRLLEATRGRGPIRFRDPGQPDPYDGLLLGEGGPVDPIHACLAVPIHADRRLLGVLTMDALDARGLDGVSDDDVRIFAALAGAVMRHAPASPVAARPRARPVAVVGRSPAMQRLAREIELLAPLPITVLVTGETGTGKELVARALHRQSPRAAGPLGVVNCAALPAQLVESELFGHVKGAFTGATAARAGRFEAAGGGTLFLDEIGDLPLAAQGQLLRVLQEGEAQRVGDDRPHRVDVRVVAATHRDLWRDAEEGRFRADLLHRLWLSPIHVPPLRERAGDVLLLAEHFAAQFGVALGGREVALRPDAVERLARYAWPGNVRELVHAVQRAVIHRLGEAGLEAGASVTLGGDDFELGPPSTVGAASSVGAGETLEATLERVRRDAFERAFRTARGNAAEAARSLGLSRSFAYKQAVRYGLVEGPVRPGGARDRSAGKS